MTSKNNLVFQALGIPDEKGIEILAKVIALIRRKAEKCAYEHEFILDLYNELYEYNTREIIYALYELGRHMCAIKTVYDNPFYPAELLNNILELTNDENTNKELLTKELLNYKHSNEDVEFL